MTDPFDAFADADPQAAEPELTTMEAIHWTFRKWDLMKGPPPMTADEAELIIRREMAAKHPPA